MNRFYYDFHIHSCLSPCGDNDMTPNNIAGVGVLAGLDIMALTDHNSCKNCPAFFKTARENGIIPVAGMELTTAEDIHVLCLFRTLEGALAFGEYVDSHRMRVPNNERIFGEQLVMNEYDCVTGKEPWFLLSAADIPIDSVPALVSRYGGVAWPAHIDREANGVIATLGVFPDTPGFACAEFSDEAAIPEYTARYPILREKRVLVSSDAHNLWSIRDKNAYLELDADRSDPETAAAALFRLLREEQTP